MGNPGWKYSHKSWTRERGQIIKAVAGGILSVSSLLAAVGQLTETLEKVHSVLADAPPMLVWAICIVGFLLGLRFLWGGLSLKSHLLHPEVLFVDPDNPRHLKGR